MRSNNLHGIFWDHAAVALMDWRLDNGDLILVQQNPKAIATTNGKFNVGDRLCEEEPSVRGELMAWFLSVLRSGQPQAKTFYLDSDDPNFNRHWENRSTPSPCGHYLRMEFRDVSDAEMQRRSLELQAFTDTLTGLPNRQCYEIEIQKRCHKGNPFALIALDLDGFKHANDLYGHVFGDMLLAAIAHQIQRSVRERTDFVARVGGDEFAVIISGEDCLEAIAQRLDSTIRSPIKINDRIYLITAAIGIAAYEMGDTPDQLYQYAEECQTRAKKRLKSWQHSPAIEAPPHWRVCDRAQSYVQLSQELIFEMATPRELALHYQPIIDMATGEAVSYEGLIRWFREGDRISPLTILDIVRQQDLGVDFCIWTIEQAQQQWKRWGCPPQKIAINVSPDWLRGDVVINALAENRGVSCEITEDALLSSPVVLGSIHQLRDRGVSCAWDDFGAEFAVFTGLADLEIDAIKLDIAITRNRKLFRAIVSMFRSLNIGAKLIAEGIETKEQRDYCAEGVSLGQGWYWGKAVEGDRLNP